jgi:hypothetical protein
MNAVDVGAEHACHAHDSTVFNTNILRQHPPLWFATLGCRANEHNTVLHLWESSHGFVGRGVVLVLARGRAVKSASSRHSRARRPRGRVERSAQVDVVRVVVQAANR